MFVYGVVLSDGLDSLRKTNPEEYREGYQEAEIPKGVAKEIHAEAGKAATKYGMFAFLIFFLGMLVGSSGA